MLIDDFPARMFTIDLEEVGIMVSVFRLISNLSCELCRRSIEEFAPLELASIADSYAFSEVFLAFLELPAWTWVPKAVEVA